MFQSLKLKSLLLGTACLMLASQAATARDFNIPQGDLKSALDSYAAQSGVQLIYSEDSVRGIRSKGVAGDLNSDDALTRILSDTGLTPRKTSSGAIGIVMGRSSASHQINPLQLAQAAPSGRIEEVLVTARKREEAVENIPISITALNAEDLKSFGVRNFADLEGVVPGLNMGGGGNGVKKDGNPFIRGVGQRETKVTLDPAVATYIDGIYIGRAAGAMLDVTDVGNIQVLRGPQGTLFGRNATGGAISVTLNKPTNNWEAQVSANIGNYGRRELSGMLNIPFIEDMVMGRLFVASTNSNGYFTNVVDNTKWGGDNRVTGIAQLRILPTDRITVDILGERTRIRETPRPQRCQMVRPTNFLTAQLALINGSGAANMVDGYNRYVGLCFRSAARPPSQFDSDAAIGSTILPEARYWVDTTTAAATVNWDIGNIGTLSDLNAKSITAWRKARQIADEDLDAISAQYLIRVQPDFDETTQFSQELQFSGKTFHDRLFLSMGGYYFKEKTPNSDLIISAGISPTTTVAPSTQFPNGYYSNLFGEPAKERLQTHNEAFAWYGQADLDITSNIQLTGGIRWTREVRWSRYSKAYVDVNTLANGYVSTNNLNGLVTYNRTGRDIYPLLTWGFGSPTYSITTASNGNQTLVSTFTPGKFIGDELKFANEAWTPMASLKYKLGKHMLERLRLDQAMLYATYSQGFHSGGVTAGGIDTDKASVATTISPGVVQRTLPDPGFGTANPITFKPEKVTNYEVGFKLAALDRRLQANLAAFYMDYADMQVTSTGNRFGIPIPFIENVGKSVIKGIEAEIVALPLPQWRILLNGSYTDADIKEWQSKVTTLSNVNGLPTGGYYYLNRSDERMPRVPRWQFFGSTEYNFNLAGRGTLTPSVGVRFASSIYHGFDRGSWVFTNGGRFYNHGGQQPSITGQDQWSGSGDLPVTPAPDAKWKTTSRPTTFIDARLAWVSEDGRLEAALWGKNLTNKDDYLVGGIPLADVLGAVGQVYANPRTFGLTFTYHFGE